MIKCFYPNKFTFKENRFIFKDPETPRDPETPAERRERVKDAAGEVVVKGGTAVVGLLETGVVAATFAMETLTGSVGQVKKGYKYLEGKYVGNIKPLPEYFELEKSFHSVQQQQKDDSGRLLYAGGDVTKPLYSGPVQRLDVSDPKIEAITGFDIQTACLGLRINQLNLFYGDALRELQLIEGLQDRSVVGGDISVQLQERIRRDKAILRKDPEDTMAQADMDEAQRQLKVLKGANTTGFKRPMPQITKTEFPPGSRSYLPRLSFDNANMVYLELAPYKKYLRNYVSDYQRQIDLYSDELEKIDYWRQQKFEQSNVTPDEQGILDENRKIIRDKLQQLQENDKYVGFNRDPNDAYTARDGKRYFNPATKLDMYLKR